MCLLFGQNFKELLEVGDTSTSEKIDEFLVSVTWLNDVDKVVSLRPRDAADCGTSKLSDKGSVRVEAIQQMNAVHWECAYMSFVQRTNVTVLSSNIYCDNRTTRGRKQRLERIAIPAGLFWNGARKILLDLTEPGIERVQALADISRSALCCHGNKTCAPIANPPNRAQLEGTPYHSPSYIRIHAAVWACGETHTHYDTHTDKQTRVTLYISRRTTHVKCKQSQSVSFL